MKIIVIFLCVLISGTAFSASGGVSSLLAPAVNVSILLFALIYFLRKPIKDFFNTSSDEISSMIQKASSKAKEAEAMMAIQKKRSQGVAEEISLLEKEHDNMVKAFGENYKKEIEEKIGVLKEDGALKIDAEKRALVGELNSNLLDLVISKAKNQMREDPSLGKTAAKNIIKGL